MSTLSSVNGNSSLASYFQRLQSAGQTSQAQGTRPSGPPPGPPPDGSKMQDKMSDALEAQGITGDSLSSLREQLDAAVQEARDSGDGDPEAVKSAVHSVLEDAGVDLDEFDAAMAPPDGAGRSESSDSTQSADLASKLQAAGIDLSEFKAGLLSMMQGESTSVASLFSSANSGSDLDLYA